MSQLNVAAEQHDLTAPSVVPQLNVGAERNDLTSPAVNGGNLKFSGLQRRILLAAAQTDAIPIRELVRKCFGKVAYGSKQEFHSSVIRTVKNGKYQAAYASVSRAVRKLRSRALLQYVPISDMEIDLDPTSRLDWRYPRGGFSSWVRLTDAGIEAVKSTCSVRSFNRSKAVKSIASWTSFNLPAVKPVRSADSFNFRLSTRSGWIRVFYHRPAFEHMDDLVAAVRKEFGAVLSNRTPQRRFQARR